MPGTTSPMRVLHVEDSLRDAEMIRDMLQADSPAYDVVHVDNRARFESTLAEGAFDVVICDFSLPDLDGLTVLRLAKDRFPDIPVLIVSGALDPGEAVECLKKGATDYLLKQRLERLPSAVKRALEEAEQHRRRQEMEAQLLESEDRFRQLAEKSREGFWFVALNPERILYVNPAMETIWGLSAEKFYQDPRVWLGAIHADDRARMQDVYEAWAKDQTPRFEEECRVVRPDGSVRWVLSSGTQIRDDAGAITRLSGLTRDITERKELEAQFHQAQKMESVGRLAGGIAHDFNNLLTAIIGYSELVLERVADQADVVADIEEIKNAGQRASLLTSQLLAFSRKQAIVPRVLDLNQVVGDLQKMLSRIIAEDIVLEITVAPSLGRTKVDPGQVEQVLLNLVVNARDALPSGGKLRISTANVVLDAAFARQHVGAVPGRYVSLTVTDTGSGMKPDVLARVFEPFFTTKPIGKGTGLGLSTVYGIVKQNNGYVTIDSTPGTGTTVTIYWPQVDEPIDALSPGRSSAHTLRGTETVLLVEDEAGVRELVRKMLERHGYHILRAKDGAEAIAIEERHEGPIHLLLTDIVMPGLNGPDLAQHLVRRRPAMEVLYMSGFAHHVALGFGSVSERTAFLPKPFASETLATKVRECLDRHVGSHNQEPMPQ
jgi:two-component system cell cycle sensor histidine kinase/response regulator CckA